jgi:hypothetical protein
MSILVFNRPDAPQGNTKGVDATPVSAEASTALIVGSNEDGGAAWMALLTHDPVEDRGAVVFIPAHTAVEVPGQGLQGLGDALESGGMPLLALSTENFLGTDIDLYVRLGPADAHALLNELGPLTVDVPSEVRIASGGTPRMLVNQGPQELTPTTLTDLLYVTGMEGDDVELGGRHLAFWEALFEAYRTDPSALRQALVKAGDALARGNASEAEYASVFEALATLPSHNVRLTILPVRQVSVGGAELYAVNADEISGFLRDTIPSSTAGRYQTDIQILNGNGEPGVGRDVAQLLVGRGFRLVRSGNAAGFGHRRTLIVTYDPSAEARKTAERARRLLGVGQVLVSAQEQGIVDLTIVVGRDFLREH